MTQAELSFTLPPIDIVREIGTLLAGESSRLILDAGAASGRNGQFLAGLGHRVVLMDTNLHEPQSPPALGEPRPYPPVRVSGDIRRPPFVPAFDVVLCNEVLHMISPTEQRKALDALRAITQQGGLHAISGYVVRPGTATVRNSERCLAPRALYNTYAEAGWYILGYDEVYLPHQYVGSSHKEHISSRAKLIAQKPWDEPML